MFTLIKYKQPIAYGIYYEEISRQLIFDRPNLVLLKIQNIMLLSFIDFYQH